jgi:uncharacterized protein (TIGR02246 family)
MLYRMTACRIRDETRGWLVRIARPLATGLLCAILPLAVCAFVSSVPAMSAHAAATDASPLQTLEQRRLKALRDNDAAALRELLAPDYVHVHSTGKVENRDEFIRGVLEHPRESMRGELRIRIYGNLAVITGEQTNRFANAGGAPATGMTYYATQVARREHGRWRFVSMQNTPIRDIAYAPSATVTDYPPAAPATMSREQRAVAAAEARRSAAIANKDFQALAELLADDYLHVYGSGTFSDRAGYIEQVRAAPRVPTRGPLSIRIYGDGAIVTGDLLNRINYPQGARVLDTVVTQVLHKTNGRWQFVSFQITPKAN